MATTERPAWRASVGPVLAISALVLALWYLLAVWLNAAGAIERVLEPAGQPWGWRELLARR